MGKKYDAVVAKGKYTTGDGTEKTRWQNVGAVIENDNGLYLLLDRSFNPAGIVDENGNGESVLISFFEPKQRDGAPAQSTPAQEASAQSADIPF